MIPDNVKVRLYAVAICLIIVLFGFQWIEEDKQQTVDVFVESYEASEKEANRKPCLLLAEKQSDKSKCAKGTAFDRHESNGLRDTNVK